MLFFVCFVVINFFSESQAKKDDDTAVNTQSNAKENNLDGHDTKGDTMTDLICDSVLNA